MNFRLVLPRFLGCHIEYFAEGNYYIEVNVSFITVLKQVSIFTYIIFFLIILCFLFYHDRLKLSMVSCE